MRYQPYAATDAETLNPNELERVQEIRSQAEELQRGFQSGSEGAGWWDEDTQRNVLRGIEELIENTGAAKGEADIEKLEDHLSTVQGWFEEPTSAPNSEGSENYQEF